MLGIFTTTLGFYTDDYKVAI